MGNMPEHSLKICLLQIIYDVMRRELLRMTSWLLDAEQGYWLGPGRINYNFLGQYLPKELWERPAVSKTGGFSSFVIFGE